MDRDRHAGTVGAQARMRARLGRIFRRRTAAHMGVVAAVAAMSMWFVGSASAALLDRLESAPSVEVRAPSHPSFLPSDNGDHAFTSLSRPEYEQSATAQVRADLTAAALGLGTDVADKEAALTDDTGQREDMSGCLKAALWDMLWDAGWDVANGYSVDLGTELDNTRDRLISCLGTRLGVGPVAATSVANYFMESVVDRGVQALKASPTTTTFVDWAAVTAWYYVP